jgi:hypothetical protein
MVFIASAYPRILRIGLGVLFLLALLQRSARADVHVAVRAPVNLADSKRKMPRVTVHNRTEHVIELQVFDGVPLSILEEGRAGGGPRDDSARCGNGYRPYRLAAGRSKSFPLWSLLSHGPGVTGDYRLRVPYVEVRETDRGPVKQAREAVSRPFVLRYGDVAPARWDSSSRPGSVVLLSTDAGRVQTDVDPVPHADEVAAGLAPHVQACVVKAHERLPWLRGAFTFNVYQYPSQDAPVLYLDLSLLGDAEVNACLGRIALDQDLAGTYEIRFAITSES